MGAVVAVFADPFDPPQQVHLALTGDPTEMVVSWPTSLPTQESKVHLYGREPGEGYLTSHLGYQLTYEPSAGWIHHVVVTGLKPGKDYGYECGGNGLYTEYETFRAAPNVGDRSNRTFVMYGDMGIFQYSDLTVRHVSALVNDHHVDVDLFYQAGDFGYGNDREAQYYEMSWDIFFEQLSFVMPNIPYMVAPGNHEESCGHDVCDVYANNFTVYNSRFLMPQNGSPKANMWFSFDFGNIHFITISTETDYPNCPYSDDTFGDQLTWLENDLQQAQADSNVDWIFVTGHQPVYSSVEGKSSNIGGIPEGSTADVQKAFESLFYQYGVDIYFDGHVHGYERSFPVYQSKKVGNDSLNYYHQPQAPVYIVNGNAGNIEGFYDSWNDNIPEWSAKRYWPNPQHGYGVLETYGASQLRWTWYRNRDEGGQPVDNDYFDWFVLDRSTTAQVPSPPAPFTSS